MREKKRVSFSLDYVVFNKFKRICELEERSLNNGIVHLIKEFVCSFEEEFGEIKE